MKRLLAILLLACAPAVAQAETFTFKTTNKAIDGVQLPSPAGPTGRPSGANVFTVATVTSYADGKVMQSAGKCSQWILPPGDAFGSSGVCTYDGADSYSVAYTCAPPANNGNDCWGRLMGTGGQFKGRTGLITFHAGQNPQGTGLWN
jgi:hypothetical protein